MLLLTTDKKYYLLEKKMLSDHNNFIHNINIYFHLLIANMPDMVQLRCDVEGHQNTILLAIKSFMKI